MNDLAGIQIRDTITLAGFTKRVKPGLFIARAMAQNGRNCVFIVTDPGDSGLSIGALKVPTASQVRIIGGRAWANGASSDPTDMRPSLLYADNNVGINTVNAFTNPVYSTSLSSATYLLDSPPYAPASSAAAVEFTMNRLFPTGKYVSIGNSGMSSGYAVFEIYGYVEPV